MPIKSITTTAADIFQGSDNLDSITFKNGSTTGQIFIRNKQTNQAEVSSTDYEISLRASEGVSITRKGDGDGISEASWRAVASATTTLEILPIYRKGRRES